MIKMKMAASMVAGARPFIDVIAATALLYLAKETPLQTFLDTHRPHAKSCWRTEPAIQKQSVFGVMTGRARRQSLKGLNKYLTSRIDGRGQAPA